MLELVFSLFFLLYYEYMSPKKPFIRENTPLPKTGIILSENTVTLWLDFSPDFPAIRDLCNPLEINQVKPSWDTSNETIVEYINFSDLSELIEVVKWHEDITILTKQPSVVERFCSDNGLTPFIYEWRLGWPSFMIKKKEEIKNKRWGNIDLGNNWNNKLNEPNKPNKKNFSTKYIITDEVLWPLLGGIFQRKKRPKLDLLVQIKTGDPVVHLFHGVWMYRGIIRHSLSGMEREYIQIDYADTDKLFVPVDELHRISKYVWENEPKLTRLWSPVWKETLAKTQEEIQKIAEELLENHAQRRLVNGTGMNDYPLEEENFHTSFSHQHTLDQDSAIADIMGDMKSERPMDRLLSWDVGFGKTEVALHAVYRAFLNQKQTIFLAPLVVLAYEHFEEISKRLRLFGVNVALLTRFSTTKEEKEVLKWLKNGSIHCVIGTHRLLSPDIHFYDLGLVVVDEEHKFGVSDKEKILKLRAGVDMLALSATPIPRSLNLALSGVKNFSILSTPPRGKTPIPTIVWHYETAIVKKAIEEELARDGKVFFVHNTIASLPILKKEIEKLVPKARVVITNGQLPWDQLEDRMMEFKLGMHNVLLTTTVIENGINFLDTNTIIIDEAEDFWLAQLHQLRGRVGRGQISGMCYLLYRNTELKNEARERLMTIANHTHLGAWFEIALRDMEIRGVGDVLGVRQSGKTRDVGVSFYLKLLEEKIEELQSGEKKEKIDTNIDLPITAYIPDEAFSSDVEKIHFYRELESVRNEEELEEIITALKSRIDVSESSIAHLFLIIRARLYCSSLGIRRINMQLGKYTLEWAREGSETIEAMKTILKNDSQRKAEVVSERKLCFPKKAFLNHGEFLKYLISSWQK